jgi:hypothetical protein
MQGISFLVNADRNLKGYFTIQTTKKAKLCPSMLHEVSDDESDIKMHT